MKPLVFGIVAGEASGDTLGADLIRALKKRYPNARFVGVAGPQMIAEGAECLAPMERLSVMGIVEVLGRLRELFQLRDRLVAHFVDMGIDAFIGIDAPDFNLRLSRSLKAHGIPTIHYVSPSVWAWRQGRVVGIRASVDLMLCLLPFEKAFYDQHGVRAEFVGHPLADQLPRQINSAATRESLNLGTTDTVVALLPGSRRGEVASLLPLQLEAARLLKHRHAKLKFLVPAINAERHQDILAQLAAQPLADVQVLTPTADASAGRSAMLAADVVILASGTATLEAMLLKRPMVVMYRVHWLTWILFRLMMRALFVSLPNLLAGKALVPELLQDQATPDNMAGAVEGWLAAPSRCREVTAEFDTYHAQLARDASRRAAEAIEALLADRQCGETT